MTRLREQAAQLLPRRQELEARLQACAAEAAAAENWRRPGRSAKRCRLTARFQQELQQGREELRG